MSREEVLDLLDTIAVSYKNFVQDTDLLLKTWEEILCQYDTEEVKQELRKCMSEDQFQYQPPTVYYLVRNLRKICEKVDYTKQVVYCHLCKRPFNDDEQLKMHIDRCLSVRYILRQYKRFNISKQLSKRDLYEMNQEEFDKKYEELLKWIQKNTTDVREKARIEFIFNPPRAEVAKKYLNQKEGYGCN